MCNYLKIAGARSEAGGGMHNCIHGISIDGISPSAGPGSSPRQDKCRLGQNEGLLCLFECCIHICKNVPENNGGGIIDNISRPCHPKDLCAVASKTLTEEKVKLSSTLEILLRSIL